MRWFLSDEAVDLEAALRAGGEEVVSRPEHHALAYVRDAMFHPTQYPLDDLALSAGAEVAVLVDPLRVLPFGPSLVEFGYARGHGRTLRNRGVTVVMFAHDSRRTLERYAAGMHRRCSCEVNDAGVHIVQTSEVGDMIRGSRRVAVWSPGEGIGRVVEAVMHARSGKTYSPRQQGRAWG